MADFDVAGAKAAGYTDAEIADHLSSMRGFDAAAARKSGYSDADIVQHLQAPSLKDQANQAIRDTVSAAAQKLNPLPGISEGRIDPFGIRSTANAIEADPIGTLLETFAHPYMALKRAKESYDAAKDAAAKGDVNAAKVAMDQAGVHLSNAINPTGAATESSEIKMATPGERSTGLGEMLGTGIRAYLGVKAPELAAKVADKVSASGALKNPVGMSVAGSAAGAAAGHAASQMTGIPGLGYVGTLLGGGVGKALSDYFAREGTAAEEASTAGAHPPPLPEQPPPLPPNQTVPPLPYEATAQGLTDAANQRMLASMKASQTMSQTAQRAVPPAPAPPPYPPIYDEIADSLAKGKKYSELKSAGQAAVRRFAENMKQPGPIQQATPPAPVSQQVPVTQPAVSPEEAPTAAPSVSPTAAETTPAPDNVASIDDQLAAARKRLIERGILPEKGGLGEVSGGKYDTRFDEGGPSDTMQSPKTVAIKKIDPNSKLAKDLKALQLASDLRDALTK